MAVIFFSFAWNPFLYVFYFLILIHKDIEAWFGVYKVVYSNGFET